MSRANPPIKVFIYSLWLILCTLTTNQSHAQQRSDLTPGFRSSLEQAIASSSSFQDQFDAQVWMLDYSLRLEKYLKNDQERLLLLRLVHHYASKTGLLPELILAVIHVESGFQRFAISSVGAQGLMQVMPFWKQEIGRSEDNLTDPLINIQYGCHILAHYKSIEKGNLSRALARYNGSLRRPNGYPEKVFDYWDKYWKAR